MVANYRYFVGSGSGTWTAPRTGLYFMNGSGAGGPGAGGYATAGGGGGGGASGKFMMGFPAFLYANDTVAYSIGAATSGGTIGNAGTAGGSTTLTFTSTNELLNGQTITLNGGGSGLAGASTNGGSGGSIGGIITGGAGGAGAGGNGARMSTAMGGGALVGANSGSAGGAVNFAGGSTSGISGLPGYVFSDSSSNAGTSTASNGGGGSGGFTPWGSGGSGGKAATSVAPTAGTGYGAGGGGGYGSVAGAAGSGGFFEVLNYDNIPASLPTMATDWIQPAGVSAGAVTKIQSGLASQSSVNLIPTNPLTTLGSNAPAGWINAASIVDSALNGKGDWSTYAGGDTSGTTTLLSRIVGILAAGTHNPQSGDTFARVGAPAGVSISADIAAIQAKTTSLTFTAGKVQADVKAVNGTTVTGNGHPGTEWGPV